MKLPRFTTAVAAVASAVAFGTTPAHAVDPAIAGQLCDLTETDDPSATDERVGVLSGGPIVGYDANDPTAIAEVYIFCYIQVGGTGAMDDPDVVTKEAEGIDFAYLPPTKVSYEAAAASKTYLCTELWVATPTGHISVYQDYASGQWVESSAAAQCTEAISIAILRQ